ncbi:CoA-transferase family III domain-containing protein [Biscogniauxia mediterranea]|nr:CoA-transferase family III domain-containing protein [Biscogniauxia mediterranea]
MSQEARIPGVYGPGTYTDRTFVPVQQDSERIFRLLASETPGFTNDEKLLSKVKFTGEEFPVIPGPIKAIPVAAALHAMAGVVADEILAIRGIPNDNREITVDTTHTAFWLGCVAVGFVEGKDFMSLIAKKELGSRVPDWERGWVDSPLKYRATGIYPTANPDVWYSVHGSMNAIQTLESIGINPSEPISSVDEAAEHIAKHTRKLTPEYLEMNNLLKGLCGSICFTPEQWNESEMGKSLASHPLVNVKHQKHAVPTPPIAFPPFKPEDKRPLAGIKVVEMTRVIAGPQIGATLASYGADIIRVNAPHLTDLNLLQLTLNAGKRTIAIDLRKPQDAAVLRSLVAEADVFVQGFRLNKMARHGLGLDDLLRVAGARGRGIVYVSENCYGPDGYYAERPGWQQIADAAAGSAHVTGRALGLAAAEPVLPSLPISDMTTGVVGALGALLALRDRARSGGSYAVHAALAAVDAYALRPDVGLYPRETVEACAERFRWAEMRGAHHVLDLLTTVWDGWKRVLGARLEEDGGWFQSFDHSAFGGGRLSILKPVVRLSDEESTPHWKTPSVPYGYESAASIKFH